MRLAGSLEDRGSLAGYDTLILEFDVPKLRRIARASASRPAGPIEMVKRHARFQVGRNAYSNLGRDSVVSDSLPSQSEAPTVTAIVPTFNRAHYIAEGLESLLSQSRKLDQIIVVDDGSTDDTESVVRRYAPAIQYVKKENGGKSTALNLALPLATGDYIWICDDDDIALPDALRHMLEAFEENTQADYVVGAYKVLEATSDGDWRISDPHVSKRREEPNLKINFLENMFTLQYASLTRRKVYVDLRGYDESLVRSQDYDMILRISRSYRGVETPHPIFLYRQHEGARGKSSELFTPTKSHAKWLSYNRQIFEEIWRTYDLAEFVPTFAVGTDQEARAALLQRAAIMASRTLWEQATLDLDQAERRSTAPLRGEELHLLKAVIRGRDSWAALADNKAALALLSDVFGRSDRGRGMVAALLRPLLWDTRNSIKQEPVAALRCLKILYGVTGIRMVGVLSRKL